MKPIAIFRNSLTEGPGYFATYLERRSLPWQLVALDEGAAVPRDPRRFRGLVFMGGAMSANDDLPWVAPVIGLIRDAVRQDVPTLGHCLGGQLMARALGGEVGANAVKEIGWGEVTVADNAVAREWFGDLQVAEAFHWHGEAFSVPPGATRVLAGEHCANQAFALGRHFAMQCHVEMTEELVHIWLRDGGDELASAAASPAVQPADRIVRNLRARLERLHALADRVYDHWVGGLGPA